MFCFCSIGIIGTVVEVLGTILLLLIAFSVAVSLSVGIAITCDQLQKSNSARYVMYVYLASFCAPVRIRWQPDNMTSLWCYVYNDNNYSDDRPPVLQDHLLSGTMVVFHDRY